MAKSHLVAFILLPMLIVGHIQAIPQSNGQAQQENSKEPHGEKAQDQAQRALLPPWFQALDTNGDGQVSLSEWRAAGRPLEEFWEYDLDGDGLITPRELKRVLAERSELKFDRGRLTHAGEIQAGSETHRGKTSFKVLLVRLEAGKTYQFDLVSPAFQSFLFLEDANGTPLVENSSPSIGGHSRLTYRIKHTGIHRVVVTSQGGFRGGPFTLSVSDGVAPPSDLPGWFHALDTDRDGQVSLSEWRAAGRPLEEFWEYDLDGDGLITPRELKRVLAERSELKLDRGRLTHAGEIQAGSETHRGKTSFKVLLVRLEAGKTYQFDLVSPAFQSFLFLEDVNGTPLVENSSPSVGGNSRLTYRVKHTGIHRVVVTSQGGFRGGPFTLSVGDGVPPPSDLPGWFHALDTDRDGQVSLSEWRAAGRPLEEFWEYDLDGDGLITPRELKRVLAERSELKFDKGRLTHAGEIQAGSETHRGKTSFKVFLVRLEAGKTYQFDLVSPAFQSFLFLEDANGTPLVENSSPSVGGNSRLTYRIKHTGIYRVVVTSQGGFRGGPFTLSIGDGVPPPSDLPGWFQELDTDRDGQVSLSEWWAAGLPLEEFWEYDLDGDGLITPRELKRVLAERSQK